MSQVRARGPHWDTWPNCPCGCGAQGMKLQTRNLYHLVGCVCAPCRGRRNRKKGQEAEKRAHRNMGGEGGTIRDDIFHAYSVELSLETKTGNQIPAKFLDFARSEWARHAWQQAAKKTPVGVQASPAIYVEAAPGEWYVIVRGGR